MKDADDALHQQRSGISIPSSSGLRMTTSRLCHSSATVAHSVMAVAHQQVPFIAGDRVAKG
jgi:hypothetical protein